MEDKKEIVICLGSSCFARGNRTTVKQIFEYLRIRHLSGMVNFHGGHCFGRCDKGPVLKLDDDFNEKLASESLNSLLDKFFKDLV
jgi:NADH:ubiquinone oxidoreductase subunit E